MRVARYRSPGNVLHMISRFTNHEFFIRSDADRDNYLRLLGRAMSNTDWKCLAYAIMSNHIHLAMLAGEAPAERWMRRVHSPFALTLNRERERIGPVFADRARMWIVPPADIASNIAYIHNNPVRAFVASSARESTWTSHRAYVGLTTSPDWLHVEEGLMLAKHSPHSFDLWVNATVGLRDERVEFDDARRAARKRGAIELGTPTGASAPLLVRPGALIRPDPELVIDTVCSVIGVELADVRSRSRAPIHVAARAILMIVGRNLGLSISAIASAVGISPQAGSRLAMRALGADEQAAALVAQGRIESRHWRGKLGKEKASPPKTLIPQRPAQVEVEKGESVPRESA
jgi:REP-associated tyrosine transposase